MDPKLTRILQEAAPTFYGQPIPEYGLDRYGFECKDGWFNILLDLGKKADLSGVRLFQVKEKFGTLRVYADDPTPEVKALIAKAEALSETTCETCGMPGSLRKKSSGWVYTACDMDVVTLPGASHA